MKSAEEEMSVLECKTEKVKKYLDGKIVEETEVTTKAISFNPPKEVVGWMLPDWVKQASSILGLDTEKPKN